MIERKPRPFKMANNVKSLEIGSGIELEDKWT